MRILLLLLVVIFISACGFNSTNGWKPTSIKVKEHHMFDLYHSDGVGFVITSNKYIYALTKEDVFISSNDGATWEKAAMNGLADTIGISNIAVSGNKMVAGTNGAGIFISNDNGKNWKQANNGLFDTLQFKQECKIELELDKKEGKWKKFTRGDSDSDGWYERIINEYKAADVNKYLQNRLLVNSLAISGNHIITFLPNAGMFVTNNDGATWEKVNLEDDTLVEYNTISFIADNKNIYAYSYHLLHRSQDHGKTWKKLHINIPLDTAYLGENGSVAYEKEEIRTMYINGKNIYAGTHNGLFVSTDEGEHWTGINNGLPNNKPISAIIHSGSTLFVCPGDYQGIYISKDQGKNWKRFSEGMKKNTDIQYKCGYINYFAVTSTTIFAGVWTSGECQYPLFYRSLKDAEEVEFP